MRDTRDFGGHTFDRIGSLEPARDESGTILEFMPQSRYRNVRGLPLNKHGAGPFCRFSVARDVTIPGVYVVTVAGQPTYIGQSSRSLADRFGLRGYGAIQPKNCFRGGQSTNCKINSLVLKHAKEGDELELWFHGTDQTKLVERDLISKIRPGWNTQLF